MCTNPEDITELTHFTVLYYHVGKVHYHVTVSDDKFYLHSTVY